MDSQVLEVMGLDNEYKLFIGGKWVPASDGGKFIAQALPEKMKCVGRILGAEFDGTECPTKIGEKTAARTSRSATDSD